MRIGIAAWGLAALGVVTGLASTASAAPRTCAVLAAKAFPDAAVTSAVEVAAGPFTPPGAGPTPARPIPLPAFCRVKLTLTPSRDSDIRSEVWLPSSGWNGKFMVVGNGAWGGVINYAALAVPLQRGYAAAATDTGHTTPGGHFAVGHPEKWADYGWRAAHETMVKGKAMVAAFYGEGLRLSYWNGCSTGGKQALKAAQRFPEDFDGIIAGAPANNWVRLQTRSLWMSRVNLPITDGPPILDTAAFDLLHTAAIAGCDALDGVRDGEIADPRRCEIHIADLVCKGGAAPGPCLTPDQAEAARRIYAGPRLKDGALFYPPSPSGAEREMGRVSTRPWDLGADQYRFYAFKDPAWDFRGLDLDRDVQHALDADGGNNDATDPDLTAFRRHGGKLIQYHGWSDGLISPEGSIDYYEAVAARQGGPDASRDFHRLFMVPAMNHCAGAYAVDWIAALEAWREQGRAPDQILGKRVAAAGAPAFSETAARPICAYPAVARYKGAGSVDDPASFTCAVAPRGSRTDPPRVASAE